MDLYKFWEFEYKNLLPNKLKKNIAEINGAETRKKIPIKKIF